MRHTKWTVLPTLLTLALAGCSHPTAPGTMAPVISRLSSSRAHEHVLGIGGVFLKSANPKAQSDWYASHLGIVATPDSGAWFTWQLPGSPPAEHTTSWFVFPTQTDYFNGPCMINYIVDDLGALLAQLQQDGVKVDPHTETGPGGTFGWAFDADGSRIELWQPSAMAFPPQPRGHVLGIGGIFLKSAKPKAQYDWYASHLGINANPNSGAQFAWQLPGNPPTAYSTTWFVFPAATHYFNGPCMINYIVDDLDALLTRLKQEGVKVDPHTESGFGGKFGWAFDQDGNRIELWEPAKATSHRQASAIAPLLRR